MPQSDPPSLPSEARRSDSRRFLACHVLGGEPADRAFVAWPGRLRHIEEVSLRLKVELEIDHWIHLCLRLSDSEQLALGSVSRTDFGDLDRVALARTLRILRGIEALLLGGSSYYPAVTDSTNGARAQADLLMVTPASLAADFVACPGWCVSLPLLLVRAAVWSQTGWQQPYLWEAYSAWRTRQAHERPGWLQPPARQILTFLVRFQSAPGQYVRRTGDNHFLAAARQIADAHQIELHLLLTALGVLAHAHELRSVVLEPVPSQDPQGPREPELRLVGSRSGPPPTRTDFSAYWELVGDPNTAPPREWRPSSTWSYSRWLVNAEAGSGTPDGTQLSASQASEFRSLVEGLYPGVAAFSFGRDYRNETQRHRVREAIRLVLAAGREADGKPGSTRRNEALSRHFTFNIVRVPDCLELEQQNGAVGPREEKLIELRLADEITATDTVFGGRQKLTPAAPRASSWRIYRHLFEIARGQGAIRWSGTADERDRYCPTALLGRFLEVAHRLRPAECVSIPIRLDGDRSLFLHLPQVPDGTDPESPEVQAAARYVPAWVLNQVMTRDLTRCQVALEDLEESSEGRFWSSLIRRAVRENHFEILLHKYLTDSLASTHRVHLDQAHSDLLPPLVRPAPDPGSEARALIEATLGSKLLALGIDVGGTFVKMRFYRLEADRTGLQGSSALRPLGGEFRVLTRGRPDEQATGSPLERFTARLVTRIRREACLLGESAIDAVGVSWPGPVRDRQIHGTSGILAQLGLSREIEENDISRILELDLAGHLAADLFATAGPDSRLQQHRNKRIVALINDGDAHALGTLTPAFLARELPLPNAGERAVVVKAGTGTAGALIHNGLPAPGLMEFGKILLDLAYEPSESPHYPQGVASNYCSSRTLPRLMRRDLPRLEKISPPIESLEVGRLAEIDAALGEEDADRARRVLDQLIQEAGRIACAGFLRQVDAELDVVALTELQTDWQRPVEPTVRARVARALALSDEEHGQSLFEARIRDYGTMRTAALLDLSESDLRRLVAPGGAGVSYPWDVVQRTTTPARNAIGQLGTYLGDLLALLYFTHRMGSAVLGGGVLSGASGQLARQAAIDRLRLYNHIEPREEEVAGNRAIGFVDAGAQTAATHRVAGAPASPAPGLGAGDDDPGTRGAAFAGALELLRRRRLDGLTQIIGMIHRLKVMDDLVVTDTSVEVPRSGGAPLELREWALDADRVRQHIDQSATRLGLVRTFTDHASQRYTYTRWLAG